MISLNDKPEHTLWNHCLQLSKGLSTLLWRSSDTFHKERGHWCSFLVVSFHQWLFSLQTVSAEGLRVSPVEKRPSLFHLTGCTTRARSTFFTASSMSDLNVALDRGGGLPEMNTASHASSMASGNVAIKAFHIHGENCLIFIAAKL